MKPILVSIAMLIFSLTAKSQAATIDLLAKKWNVKQVNIESRWQTIQVKKEEKGPYLWLKKGGDAEMLYMQTSTGQWRYDDQANILTLIEKQTTTSYLVESITTEKLSLKVLGKRGSMDPEFLLFEAADHTGKN